MNPFGRFILLLLVVGIGVNLLLVIVSDARGRQGQLRDVEEERRAFETVMQNYGDAQRQAEIAVEWQKRGPDDQVIESSLLIRRRAGPDNGGAMGVNRRVARVLIPGSRIYLDGLALNFGPAPDEELQLLRDRHLSYFWHLYGEGQAPAEGYGFVKSPEVPMATRIHPERGEPTEIESHVWRAVWNVVDDLQGAGTGGIAGGRRKAGLTVIHITPATREVRNGKVYLATLGLEGLTIEEEFAPGLFQGIKEDADASEARP